MKTKHFASYSVIFALAACGPFALAADTVEVKPGEEVKIAVKPDGKVQTAAGQDVKIAVMPAIEKGSLTSVIQDSVTFSILTKALKAAELDTTLGTKGTYTIFAPTDEAFEKLPAGTLDKLMLPENKEKLRSLLLYHVVAGQMTSSELKDGEVKTMNGEKIKIDVDGTTVKVGDTKVFTADTMASNGIMHSIGKVLVPKSLDNFAGLEN